MTKQRIEWVDIAKYVCIICVMASHLESMTSEFWALFGPFFLTLFFFCSGYVYKHRNNFKDFFLKKVCQLFVPWLVFSLFNIILSQIFSFNEHGDLKTELMWNFLQIRGLNDGMWFVAALFVAYIPFYFFIKWYETKEKTPHREKILLVIAFGLSLISIIYTYLMEPTVFPWNSVNLPWHLEYIFQAMFYMILGYLFRNVYETKFNKYNSVVIRIVLVLIYLCLIYAVPLLFDIAPIIIVYDYVCQLLGIFTVIAICKVLKTNTYIAYIGGNTLICFGLHGKVLSIMQTIIWKIAEVPYSWVLSNVLVSSVFSIILTVIMSVVLIVPIWIINHYFPFVIGRSYKKRD